MLGTLAVWLILFVLAAIVSDGYEGDETPKPYYFRHCEGRTWLRQFPGVPKEEMRRFLSIFVDAFGFRQKDRLKFSPDDRIMDAYNAIYRPMPSVDNMELEEFFCRVEDTYGVEVACVCAHKTNMTLGELFMTALEGRQ
jgi:hypothetical protein